MYKYVESMSDKIINLLNEAYTEQAHASECLSANMDFFSSVSNEHSEDYDKLESALAYLEIAEEKLYQARMVAWEAYGNMGSDVEEAIEERVKELNENDNYIKDFLDTLTIEQYHKDMIRK